MVTFHKLGELGRLGNQLFQYAALKGLASKNGYTAKIPNPQTMNWHGQTCLLDRFNIECDYLTQDDVNTLQNLYEEPNWQKYDTNFFNLPDNTSVSTFGIKVGNVLSNSSLITDLIISFNSLLFIHYIIIIKLLGYFFS